MHYERSWPPRQPNAKSDRAYIDLLVWIAYTVPLATLQKHPSVIYDADAHFDWLCDAVEVADYVRINGNNPSYVQCPALVRCVNCGKVHSNTLGIAEPVISQCTDCYFKPRQGLALYHNVCSRLQALGYYTLTRERMLAFNATAVHWLKEPDGMSYCAREACKDSHEWAELSATIANLAKHLPQQTPEEALSASLNKKQQSINKPTVVPYTVGVTIEDM